MIYVALLEVDNDIIIRGDRCVTTVQDLYQVLIFKDTNEIRITKDFAEKFFTPSGLVDFIQNAKSVNPYIRIVVDSEMVDFQLQAVNRLQSIKSAEEFTYLMQNSPREILDTIGMLCDSYKSAYSETLIANNKVSSLQLINSQLQQKLEDAKDSYKRLTDSKNDLSARLQTLVARINYSYDKKVDESKLLKLTANRYTKILYIKERTRVHYVDTLVYYMQEILKTLYGVPARVVAIEPNFAYGNIQLYSKFKPHWDLSYNDVYMSDIMMAGFQSELMNDILKNPSNVEYLIVLDRGQFAIPHIDGPNVEVIYTMSDKRDNYDDIVSSRIISYSGQTLNIPYIQDFDQLSSEDRMIKYSSMPIIKSILELIERR